MDKKLISGAIASAVAISATMPATAAGPNAKPPLNGPLSGVACEQVNDGVDAHWYDPAAGDYFAGDTKFGGDLEVDANFHFYCEAESESFGSNEEFGTGTVDVDLSQDESDPFWYECLNPTEEGAPVVDALCWAHVGWDDLQSLVDEAAVDFWEGSSAQEECEEVGGTFYAYGSTLDHVASFGVKEMNPGGGNGRQNYVKSFASCPIEPAP